MRKRRAHRWALCGDGGRYGGVVDRDRIELVIMTACAPDAQTEKDRSGGVRTIDGVFEEVLLVDRADGCERVYAV